MTELCLPLTCEEEKGKRLWLLATFCIFVIFPIVSWILLFLLSDHQISPDEFQPLLLRMLNGIFVLTLFYYCSYKKGGTKLLTLILCLAPLNYFSFMFESVLAHKELKSLIEAVCDVTLFSWWYFLSFKLRGINKKQKQQKKVEQPKDYADYLHLLNNMRASTCLEELDDRFSSLVKTWPEYNAASNREYNQKKAAFNQEDQQRALQS